MQIGSDTGGTFTDLVAEDGRVAKVLSTPDDPGTAVRSGVAELGQAETLAHGTTVATNALLERRGAAVALVTTAGFADVIEIARQDRPSLYDLQADRPEPLVPRERRVEVVGRLDATGAELEPVSVDGVVEAVSGLGAEAVAVCLLHADLSSAHEEAVAAALSGAGHDVSCSHEVSPEFREYERTVTTALNAYLRPACRRYLHSLADVAGSVTVMTSAGGLVPVAEGAELPVSLLLSGPAGGVRAASAVAEANGFADALTFDMGGTSTDVCLILDGRPAPAVQREVAGLPVRMPSLDVHTIGAGGGSIARVDPGGALVVGPQSAGARPGPACYGLGGTEPTVTDANLVLGRIPAGSTFGSLGELSVDAAEAALSSLGVGSAAEAAQGVVDVVDASMIQALRRVSIERGVDPRGAALIAFGGAGPLHAVALAEALGMATVIVPARAGVFSAVGLLCSPRRHDVVRSWPTPGSVDGLDGALAALGDEARAAVGGGGDVVVTTAVDCRYAGQSHELTVPSVEAFGAEHRRRNGYERPEAPVEVVALRAAAEVPAPLAVTDLPPVDRPSGAGPVALVEPDTTVWVPSGWRASSGAAGAMVLERSS